MQMVGQQDECVEYEGPRPQLLAQRTAQSEPDFRTAQDPASLPGDDGEEIAGARDVRPSTTHRRDLAWRALLSTFDRVANRAGEVPGCAALHPTYVRPTRAIRGCDGECAAAISRLQRRLGEPTGETQHMARVPRLGRHESTVKCRVALRSTRPTATAVRLRAAWRPRRACRTAGPCRSRAHRFPAMMPRFGPAGAPSPNTFQVAQRQK
jgi:hypothetical protein